MTGPALYGIRHHGPGSARSLREALAELEPDVVLIEGPPEADGLLELVRDPQMRPPVALLGYVPGQPKTAAFWPFAVFSPEWQAIRYALRAGVPVRFCDLPAAHQLAMADSRRQQSRTDPISDLATAAGYDDPERWWEDVVEHVPGPAVFDALAEAIGFLRAEDPEPDQRDVAREAYMRKVLRRTAKEGYQRIAVVCGAWHVPALQHLPPAAADDRLLRGLPKVKATFTWIPWTYGRLAYTSGYGAGIRSPGWYDHLFSCDGQPVERWLAKAAAVLRDEGVPASSAHVIESVRLAEALAALRGRPLAGLEEVTEAARAVLCEGSDLLVGLIQRRLVVGERLGAVPAATPMMPLQRDLQDQQRSLRLRPEAQPRDYDLDLRKPNDLARSHLLHRLTLLGVRWGAPQQGRTQNIGTFRESWQLTWGLGPDRGEHVGQHGRGRRVAAGPFPGRRGHRAGGRDRLGRAVPARRSGRRPARGARGGQGPRRAGGRRDAPDGGAACPGPGGPVRRRARHRPRPARRSSSRDDHPDLRRPARRGDIPGRGGRTGHARPHRRRAFGHQPARGPRQPHSLAGYARPCRPALSSSYLGPPDQAGPRGSWPAAACCFCTTTRCSPWPMRGWPG